MKKTYLNFWYNQRLYKNPLQTGWFNDLMKLTTFNRTLLYTSYYIVWLYSFTYLSTELIFIKENSSMSSNKHYEPYRANSMKHQPGKSRETTGLCQYFVRKKLKVHFVFPVQTTFSKSSKHKGEVSFVTLDRNSAWSLFPSHYSDNLNSNSWSTSDSM